jgi:uncharacterized protein YjiS (DUF1127 family)
MRVKERYPSRGPKLMSPAEWGAFKARLIRQAKAEQAAAIHKAVARGAEAAFRAAGAIAALVAMGVARACSRRIHEREAAVELNTLNNYELKGMGVTRCEIDTWVRLPSHEPHSRPPLIAADEEKVMSTTPMTRVKFTRTKVVPVV